MYKYPVSLFCPWLGARVGFAQLRLVLLDLKDRGSNAGAAELSLTIPSVLGQDGILFGTVGAYDWDGAVLKESRHGRIVPPRQAFAKEFPLELKNHAAYLGQCSPSPQCALCPEGKEGEQMPGKVGCWAGGSWRGSWLTQALPHLPRGLGTLSKGGCLARQG